MVIPSDDNRIVLYKRLTGESPRRPCEAPLETASPCFESSSIKKLVDSYYEGTTVDAEMVLINK